MAATACSKKDKGSEERVQKPGVEAGDKAALAPSLGTLEVTLAGVAAKPMTALATPIRAGGSEAYEITIAEGKHECGEALMQIGGEQVLWFTVVLTNTIMNNSGKREWLLRSRGFDGVLDGQEGIEDLKPWILTDTKVDDGVITTTLPAFKLKGESTGKELAVSGVLKATVCPAGKQKQEPVATKSEITVKLAGRNVEMKGVYYLPGHEKDEFFVYVTQHSMACESLRLGNFDKDVAFQLRFKTGAIDRLSLFGATVPAQYSPETNAKTATYTAATKKLEVAGSLDIGGDFGVELSGAGTAHECPAF